jgi:arsenate reductase
VRVLSEIGITTEDLRSKSFTEYRGKLPLRYLIVVCAAADRACPTAWLGVAERLFWRIEDPARCEDTADDLLERFREIRDEIDERIADWLDSRCCESAIALPFVPLAESLAVGQLNY